MNVELTKELNEGLSICTRLIDETRKDEEVFKKSLKGELLEEYCGASEDSLNRLKQMREELYTLLQKSMTSEVV